MSHYDNFRRHKEVLNELKKKEFSERTLKYYNMITEMLERGEEYGSSFPFLESVYSYIEKNEFITDNQCEAVDRISAEPEQSWGSADWDMGSPF